MDIKRINHIGIVVADLEVGKIKFGKLLGLDYLYDEISLEYNCKIAFFRCGEVLIELVTPTGPGPSQTFLKSHGEGLHHICYEVSDIDKALAVAKVNLSTEYETPKPGAGNSLVFFLDSESICGVETEFVELKK